MLTRFLILFFQHLGFLLFVIWLGQNILALIREETLSETAYFSMMILAFVMATGSAVGAMRYRVDGVRIVLKAKPEQVPTLLKNGFESVKSVSEGVWLVGQARKDWRVELVEYKHGQVNLHFTSRTLFSIIRRPDALNVQKMMKSTT